jgi:hypothetical protein
VKRAANDRSIYLLPLKYEAEKCFIISDSRVNKHNLVHRLKHHLHFKFEHDLMSIVIIK